MDQLTPRERRQARTREEILKTALAIISESGPDSLSMRGLADRVDYSAAGLYEYFDSKDDIIDAVCGEGDRRLQLLLREVSAALAPIQYLVELGLAYIRFAKENEEHFLLMYTQVPEGPTLPFKMLEYNETYQILIDGVKRSFESGDISTRPTFDLDDIAYGLWAAAHGMAMLQLTSLKIVDYEFQSADRVTLEAIVKGFAN